MSSEADAFLDTLRQAVGAAHVLTDGDLSAYERDWRGRMQGKALAVVRPANAAEVAAVVPVAGDNRAGLHQALAEVVRMACDGARWDASWAAQLSLALEVSAEVMLQDAVHATAVAPGAHTAKRQPSAPFGSVQGCAPRMR